MMMQQPSPVFYDTPTSAPPQQSQVGDSLAGGSANSAAGTRREPRKLVLVGASEMEEAVRRTVLLHTGPTPPPITSQRRRTVVLDTTGEHADRQPGGGGARQFFSMGGIKVTAEDAARVNGYLSAGATDFFGRQADANDTELGLRLQRDLLQVTNEPIGDVWLELYLDETSVKQQEQDVVVLSNAEVGELSVVMDGGEHMARLFCASFGAFKAAGGRV
jgi:hypothetical protein